MFTLTALAPREAETRIIECDLRARQQTLAILDTTTGEVEEKMLMPEGEDVLEFYSPLPKPGCVGIEATGSMSWFVKLLEELGIEGRVGDPSQIWVGRAPEEET